jgi:hypothetical protein
VRKRALLVLVLALGLVLATAVSALAGSPHFVDDQTTLTQDGNTLTVDGKLAGLGDEDQVHVVLSATAACVNHGDNKPQADNKQSLNAAGDFPVQGGKADFLLSLTAVFQPSCSPPMTVEYSNVVVTDTTNGISLAL